MEPFALTSAIERILPMTPWFSIGSKFMHLGHLGVAELMERSASSRRLAWSRGVLQGETLRKLAALPHCCALDRESYIPM